MHLTLEKLALSTSAMIEKDFEAQWAAISRGTVDLLPEEETVTVDGHLGIVTVGPPEFDLELR